MTEIYIPLILLVASFVQGLTGFGLALVAVASLSLFLEPTISVPLAGIFGWLITFPLVFKTIKDIEKRVAIMLIVGSIPGSILGARLLKTLNHDLILISMGCVLVISGIYFLWPKKKGHRTAESRSISSLLVGLLSGIFGASVGEPGPPVIAYLSNKAWNARKMKATLSLFFMIQMIGSLAGFYINGFLTKDLGIKLLWGVPGFILGTMLGLWAFEKMSKSKINYHVLVHLFLILIGIRLFVVHLIAYLA